MHEYRPGRWTALVTDDALAVFHPDLPDAVARELWQLTSEGRRLGAWVEYLAAAGIAALPSFAMVESHPEGARVLVRGELSVTAEGRVLSGRGYATWREEVVATTQPVLVTAEDDDGAWLPVTGGIVRAGQVRATVSAAPAAPVEDDDVEHTVARMPALAAAVGSSAAPATPAVPDTAAQPDPEFAPRHHQEPGTAPAAAPAMPPAPAESAPGTSPAPAEPAPDTPVAPAQGAPGTPASPAPAPAASTDAASTDDDYDFLLWPTGQHVPADAEAAEGDTSPVTEDPAPGESAGANAGTAGTAGTAGAVQPATAAAATAAATGWSPEQPAATSSADSAQVDLEATRAPEPDEDYEPAGIIDSVPGRLAPPTGRPVAPPPGTPPVPGAPVAEADDGDHDGHTILTSEVPSPGVPSAPAQRAGRPPAQPARTELVLSTGARVEMTRPVLIGRAPEAARFAGSEVPRLLSVPNLDVSGTHVEIRPAGGHVVVTDMNSTNGTVMHLPEQPAFRLQPGTGVPVAPGAVVEIGEGLTIRVEPIEALA